MSDRDPLADMIHRDQLVALIEGPRGALHRRTGDGRPLADAIMAAFDVTPKPVDTAPPPAETFNAITDWREPVPGWDTVTYKTLGSAVVTREYTVPKGQ